MICLLLGDFLVTFTLRVTNVGRWLRIKAWRQNGSYLRVTLLHYLGVSLRQFTLCFNVPLYVMVAGKDIDIASSDLVFQCNWVTLYLSIDVLLKAYRNSMLLFLCDLPLLCFYFPWLFQLLFVYYLFIIGFLICIYRRAMLSLFNLITSLVVGFPCSGVSVLVHVPWRFDYILALLTDMFLSGKSVSAKETLFSKESITIQWGPIVN